MSTDKITTYAGLVAVIAGVLCERGVYPDEMAIVAGVAAAIWAFFTNRLDKTYLGR